MDGFELYDLGRKLMQIGEDAIPDTTSQRRQAGAVYAISDVFEHPETVTTEIADRTGLQASHLDASASTPSEIDERLAAAAGIQDPGQAKEVVAALEKLARQLAGTLSPDLFDWYTADTPPWDTGRPQAAIRELAEAGSFRGRVLEVGCGTGEITLLAAALGLPTVGVDPASTAIEIGRRKARERGLQARFLVGNAFELSKLGEQFDTVIDSGLFHVFSDPERVRYADSLATVMPPGARLFLLCYSDRHAPGIGPRRVSQDEIRATFAGGWRVEAIEPATLENNKYVDGVPAWLATITRT
jgi:SAM-dependent methyltransferase